MTFLARCVGNMVEWECRRCHHVVQSRDVPAAGEEHCSGCTTVLGLAGATVGIADLIADRDRLAARVRVLEKQAGALEDELFELRGRVPA